MHLDAGAVQRDGLDLDLYDLSALQLLERTIKHARLGPAAHTRVDRVLVAEPLGQAAPLAAVLRDVQDRVEHLQVRQPDVASLKRKTVLDLIKLRCGDLHPRSLTSDPRQRN